MRTLEVPRCHVCGAEGRLLYERVADRLFAFPGSWNVLQCCSAECGLLWLNPMPAPEDIHLAYQNYYTHAEEAPRTGRVHRVLAAAKRGYVANHYGYRASLADRVLGLLPWLYPGRTSELDFSVMWLPAQQRGRLLDVGAGSGWLIRHMNGLGWQAEGLDFDPRAVRRARASGLVMHFGGLPDQRFPDASFDAVTMSHSIEHVHDPIGWLTEVRRILKPGATLSIATPNARSFLHRRFGVHWFPLDPPRHLYLFTRDALQAALRRAGFHQLRIWTSVRDANGWAYLGSRAIRAQGRFDMTAPRPRLERLRGRAFQLLEAARLRVDADAGEELVAMAER